MDALTQNFLSSLPSWVLLGSGAAIGYFKNLYAPVLEWVDRRFWISATIAEPDAMYRIVDQYLNQIAKDKGVKNLYLRDSTEENKTVEPLFVPGFGVNYLWHDKNLYRITRSRTDQPGANKKPAETINIKILLGSRHALRSLTKKALELDKKLSDTGVEVYQWGARYEDYWGKLQTKLRPLSSVVLPDGVETEVTQKIRKFLSSEEEYQRKGIPYHLGMLFSGIPGSGKTSFVSGIAKEFNMNLYLINLANITDGGLVRAVSQVPRNSIVLFEDIDTVAPKRETEKFLGVSLSTLLNVLDGFLSGHGNIFCMTTNYPEALDSALLRSGRADIRVHFGFSTKEQVISAYRIFFPNCEKKEEKEFLEKIWHPKLSMSDVQEKLFEETK